jgi:hypothetical protein
MNKTQTDTPFFLDFAFELPEGVTVESNTQARDCTTWGVAPTDDD